MKLRAILSGLLLVGLIGMVGCDSKPAANDSGKKDAAKKTSQVTPNTPAVIAKTGEANSSTSGSVVDTSNLTLVALSVPNMT